MIIEINDATTPMLQAIKVVSRDVAYEQMSKIGNKIRVNAGNRMTRSRHSWLQKQTKAGKRSPYYSKSKTKEFGQRTKLNGGADTPRSMKNMISSFLMEKSGVLMVGGKNKAFTPIKRKDGEIVGTEKRQGAITPHTQSIIHKLDTGKRNKDHGWGPAGILKKSMVGGSTTRGMGGRLFKGRGFMKDGFRDSVPYMKTQLTSGYEKTIGRAVNKVSVKIKPSKRVIA